MWSWRPGSASLHQHVGIPPLCQPIPKHTHIQTHGQTHKHRASGCLMGFLTEWPIVMVTAVLHQSIQGTDGRCATGGICFNEHTCTHPHWLVFTGGQTHKPTVSFKHARTHWHTHTWMHPCSEGGYWTTSSICSTSQRAFIQGQTGVVIGSRAVRRWREAKERGWDRGDMRWLERGVREESETGNDVSDHHWKSPLWPLVLMLTETWKEWGDLCLLFLSENLTASS